MTTPAIPSPLNTEDGRGAIRGQAFVRAADAMLRVLGATEVQIRFAVPTTDGAPSIAEDVAISPVVVLPLNSGPTSLRLRYELLVSASAATQLAQDRAAESVEALFNSALGVLYRNRLLRTDAVALELFGGIPCLFRITVGE